MTRQRADTVLAERGLMRSRASAAEAIRAGRVRLGEHGKRIAKPSELIDPGAELTLTEAMRYVSRGGIKLENALAALEINVADRSCLDVGASAGGFTDCLLQRGAERVIALDVAHGQLDWKIRNDPRVIVMERVNARALDPMILPFEPSFVTVDVSFISLAIVLPAIALCVPPGGELFALVKPQFELGRERVGKGGVVRDAGARRDALRAAARTADDAGLALRGFASSGLPGPRGNLESFIWCSREALPGDGRASGAIDVETAIAAVEP